MVGPPGPPPGLARGARWSLGPAWGLDRGDSWSTGPPAGLARGDRWSMGPSLGLDWGDRSSMGPSTKAIDGAWDPHFGSTGAIDGAWDPHFGSTGAIDGAWDLHSGFTAAIHGAWDLHCGSRSMEYGRKCLCCTLQDLPLPPFCPPSCSSNVVSLPPHPKTSSVWTAAQPEVIISLWASGHLVLAFVVRVWRWEVGQAALRPSAGESSAGATLLQTHRMCASACARALFLRLKVPQYRDGLVGAARQNFGGLFMSPSNLGR